MIIFNHTKSHALYWCKCFECYKKGGSGIKRVTRLGFNVAESFALFVSVLFKHKLTFLGVYYLLMSVTI